MKKLLYTALALTALVACNKGEDLNTTDNGAVKFGAEIVETRASGTQWANNDEVGIYMLKNSDQTILDNNVKYTSSATGVFTVDPSNAPIYYPVSGNVDFVAYYPYATLTSNSYAINVATQTDLPAIDLLWSNNLTNKSKSKTAQNLTFTHKLANVVLVIQKGDGVTDADLSNLKVTLKDVNTTADFNVLTGVISNDGTSADVKFLTATDGKSSEAILLPSDISSKKMVFEITDNASAIKDLQFEYTFPATTTLTAGTKSTYTVTVTRTAVVFSGAIITSWGNGNSGPITGDEVFN